MIFGMFLICSVVSVDEMNRGQNRFKVGDTVLAYFPDDYNTQGDDLRMELGVIVIGVVAPDNDICLTITRSMYTRKLLLIDSVKLKDNDKFGKVSLVDIDSYTVRWGDATTSDHSRGELEFVHTIECQQCIKLDDLKKTLKFEETIAAGMAERAAQIVSDAEDAAKALLEREKKALTEKLGQATTCTREMNEACTQMQRQLVAVQNAAEVQATTQIAEEVRNQLKLEVKADAVKAKEAAKKSVEDTANEYIEKLKTTGTAASKTEHDALIAKVDEHKKFTEAMKGWMWVIGIAVISLVSILLIALLYTCCTMMKMEKDARK